MIILALAAAAVSAAKAGVLHTYKDWIAGCDNVRSCQANALVPQDGGDDYLMLTLMRGGAPGDRAILSVPLPDKVAPGSRFALNVDGMTVATFTARTKDSADLPLTPALAAALASGQQVTLVDATGSNHGEASLAGPSAALLYIDDQQHRAGTIGALKAPGARPDARTSPAPSIRTVSLGRPLTVTSQRSRPPALVHISVTVRPDPGGASSASRRPIAGRSNARSNG